MKNFVCGKRTHNNNNTTAQKKTQIILLVNRKATNFNKQNVLKKIISYFSFSLRSAFNARTESNMCYATHSSLI